MAPGILFTLYLIILPFSNPLNLGKLLGNDKLNYAGRTDETVKAQRRLLTGNPGGDLAGSVLGKIKTGDVVIGPVKRQGYKW